MPGFCSCGFMPRPSAGIQSSRSNGFAPKHIVIRKNSATTPSVPVTHGIIARFARRGSLNTAIAEYEREDEAPEEQRPRLPRPEGGEGVDLRQVRARVRRDELDREVVREERGPDADRREQRERERRVERRARRSHEIRAPLHCRRRTTRSRVQAAISRATQSDSSPTRISPDAMESLTDQARGAAVGAPAGIAPCGMPPGCCPCLYVGEPGYLSGAFS